MSMFTRVCLPVSVHGHAHILHISRGYTFSLGCAVAEKNRRWHVFNIFVQQESAVKEIK